MVINIQHLPCDEGTGTLPTYRWRSRIFHVITQVGSGDPGSEFRSGLSASDALTCFVLHPLWIRPTSLLCSPSTVCWGAASQFRNILYILPVLGVKSTPPHPSSILPSTIAQLLLSSVLISFLFNVGRDWQLGGVLRWWIPAPGSLPFRETDSQTVSLLLGGLGVELSYFWLPSAFFILKTFWVMGLLKPSFLRVVFRICWALLKEFLSTV